MKVPSILQMEMTECGAASLGMILAYYKLWLPLEKLRLLCGVSRDGSNALSIVKAARSLGLDARGFKYEPDDLGELQLPLIIHWNFDHFLVLEGRKGSTFFLNDPACGRREVSYEEFDKSFSGLAIQLIPTEAFKPGGAPQPLLWALLSKLKNAKMAIFYIFLCSVLLAVPGIIIPTTSRVFVDEVLGRNSDWLLPLILALALTAFAKMYLTWLQKTTALKVTMSFFSTSSASLFQHILRLPMEFYSQRSPGELEYRLRLNARLAKMISGQASEIFTSFFMVSFYLLVMFQYDAPLALAGTAIAAINIAMLKLVNAKRQTLNQSLIQEKCKLMGVIINGIQLIETIKAAASDFDFFSKWAGHQAKTVNAEQRMSVSSIYMIALPELLSALNVTAILTFGAWRVMNGDMTMGMLVAFQSLMAGFLSPVSKLVGIGAQIQEAKGDLDKVNDITNYKEDPIYAQDGKDEGSDGQSVLEGDLELRDISFGYAPLGEPLIEGFNLHLRPGKRIALVGSSGSGKSTVGKIAGGLYKPWSGEILLDGKPASAYPRSVIENSLAIVDQEIVMFSGTVRDNLTMWNPMIDDRNIMGATADADIHSELAARMGGYGAELIEDGRNFSGGQRQRLEIARSLVNNPSILILDEATSSLDPETEKTIDDNLRRRGCSCLIVAHRLSTIRDCDEIIVMAEGKIVQRGTHEELIKDEGSLYSTLIKTE